MKQIVAYLMFLFLVACTDKQSLPPQQMVDMIRVEQNHPKQVLVTLHNKDKIKDVVDFINTKNDEWSVPWYGPPVGQIYLTMYRNDKLAGNFYVGPYFFGRDLENFWSQPATKNEIAELGSILDVDLLEIINEAE